MKQYIIGALSTFLLMGFSGQEKFVELEGYLNGRETAKFRRSDDNVKTVLSPGTRGEILKSKKMKSGNYGLLVRPISGDKAGQKFWVYYNVNRPDLKLYEDAPSEWGPDANLRNPAIDNPELAKGAEAIRETPAIEALGNADNKQENPEQKQAVAAVEAITSVNENANKQGTELNSDIAGCATCQDQLISPVKETPGILQYVDIDADPNNKMMDASCSNIMGDNGELGPWGKRVMAIMLEPKYKAAFTRKGALGKFCPKFDSLNSTTEKLQAWTWFWTSLAHKESSCDQDVKHPTKDKNGRVINPTTGFGLWAMETRADLRKARGSACNDIKSVAGQARCSIDIMYKTQLSKGLTASVNSGSYWGPIHRRTKELMPNMKRFNLCF